MLVCRIRIFALKKCNPCGFRAKLGSLWGAVEFNGAQVFRRGVKCRPSARH